MSVAPDHKEIFDRAREEGRRRLGMSLLEQVTTGFIAGVTIIFGIIAFAVVVAYLEGAVGDSAAEVAGALAFSIGMVFLIVGRTELFSENFFDPVATAIEKKGVQIWVRLVQLWATILVFNLVGGAVLAAVMIVEGALPAGSEEVLVRVAEDIHAKPWTATLARAVLAGALVALLSYMLKAVNTVTARILVTVMVGFFLALGPFDHAAVSGLHLLFGIWLSDAVVYVDLLVNISLSVIGNVVGGLFLITFTHAAQVKGAD